MACLLQVISCARSCRLVVFNEMLLSGCHGIATAAGQLSLLFEGIAASDNGWHAVAR